jgi:hypothetical protein
VTCQLPFNLLLHHYNYHYHYIHNHHHFSTSLFLFLSPPFHLLCTNSNHNSSLSSPLLRPSIYHLNPLPFLTTLIISYPYPCPYTLIFSYSHILLLSSLSSLHSAPTHIHTRTHKYSHLSISQHAH